MIFNYRNITIELFNMYIFNIAKPWFHLFLFGILLANIKPCSSQTFQVADPYKIYDYAVDRAIVILKTQDPSLLSQDTLLIHVAPGVQLTGCEKKPVKCFILNEVHFEDGTFPILTLCLMEIRGKKIEVFFAISFLIVNDGNRCEVTYDGSYLGFVLEYNAEDNTFTEQSHYFANEKR